MRALFATLCVVACAGCIDVFALPIDGRDLSHGGDGPVSDGFSGGDAGNDDGGADDAGVDAGDDASVTLPASCAKLVCTPVANEGDVSLDSGTVSGCHAYRKLTIGGPAVKIGRDPAGFGFAACADTIIVSGLVNANSQGYPGGQGPGAGKLCGSGGSHGGAGADPGMCGMGATYGDPMLPRTFGSGGGGMGPGAGGGSIELAATQITMVAAIVAADGETGIGITAGGGAGGSILLRADHFTGAGQLYARGGAGTGLAGGGGGGGRIALWGDQAGASISSDVKGGSMMASGSGGGAGSLMQLP